MKLRPQLVAFALVLGQALYAADAPATRPDITLADGRVLKACKVMSSDPASLVILHSGGVETVALEKFPAEMQAQYEYDATKADAHRKAVAEQKAKHDSVMALREEELRKQATVSAAASARKSRLEEYQLDAQLEILQVLDNGVLAKGYARQGRQTFVDVPYTDTVAGVGLDKGRLVQRTRMVREDARPLIDLGDRFFVECDTRGFIDGQVITVRMWHAGTYAYTNTMGARATVKRYTTIP